MLASVFALLLCACTSDQEPGDPAVKATTDNATASTNATVKATTDSGTADTVTAEAVGAIEFNGSVIAASVISTGCTLQEHFKVEHEVQDGACRVTLVRTKSDFCRRAPFLIDVEVPWEPPAECAQMTVEITNPTIDMEKNTIKESSGRQSPEQ